MIEIDGYFFYTELVPIELTEAELAETAELDSLSSSISGSQGVVIHKGHVFVDGEDKGRVGKANL